MGNVRWTGNAPERAQVNTWTFANTWDPADVITLTIGSKSVAVVTGSATIATFLATLLAAYEALETEHYPEFKILTPANPTASTFTLTANEAGRPIAVTISTNSSAGTINGGASSTGTVTTANSSPNSWGIAGNWDTGAVPVNADDVFVTDTDIPIKYDLDQNAVTLASLTVDMTGEGVGLPRYNSNGFLEHLQRFLKIKATVVRILTNCERFYLDLHNAASTVDVDSGAGTEILLKGTHGSVIVRVTRGIVHYAPEPGDAFTTLTVFTGYSTSQGTDADVTVGHDASTGTVAAITQGGGVVRSYGTVTTWTQTFGEANLCGVAACTTADVQEGTFYWRSNGTITTLKGGAKGRIDNTIDKRTKTATNTTLSKGAALWDPDKKITFTNPFLLQNCKLKDVDLDLGSNFSLQRS